MLRALLAWLCAALLLVTASAAVLARAGTGSDVLGYISSGISFICAAVAGRCLIEKKGEGLLLQAAVLSVLLTILLLTFGFLISDRSLEPSGILSVATFTVSGVLFGCVLLGKWGRGRKKSRKGISVRSSG